MTLNLSMSEHEDLKPRITVFGVGGAGGNAVNNMIEKALEGVEFVVANTDAQALQQSKSRARIQMGVKATEGLGAGARPSVGASAAEETIEEIVDHLVGAHMCFITAGMGGGTGTGAAPIIAQAARELGVLTVGVVTKPFQFEGPKRMRQAEAGIEALQKVVDTLIIIPNQNLFRLANEKTTFTEAFALADDVLYQGVKGVTDLMVRPGLINLDFADVRAVMDEMGKAMMGTGEGTGDDRAVVAAEKAISNPLLDEISLKGAKGVLINITGGYDLTLFELDEAANRIREEVDPDANIIVGSTLDPDMEGGMRVSVVATGIDAAPVTNEIPVPRRSMAEPLKPTPAPEPAKPTLQVTSAQPIASQPAAQPEAAQGYDRTLFEAPTEAPAAYQPPAQPMQPAQQSMRPQPAAQAPQPVAQPRPAPQPAVEDELPPPAYQSRPAQQYATEAPAYDEEASFVAPRPRAPGQPSPEALARLQAAVNKVPAAGGYQRPAQGQQPMAASRSAAPQQGAEKGRFGINSLINRMTGHAGEGAAATQRTMPAAPQHQAYEEEAETDQDRIEIPAFLRRQAN
ncbi:cell division protein FtsZ [Rhodobacter aestuarii]|uniref:Cell division protein FtsZ n=1 Tax=Rhodobacter aestuarii TaxID=453582 RepID=A0A1N7IW31_9RHOB|nr:cell division protein FtsZ [Rhodobacter aestuarii]PTV97477.1 cell division protein FtsZ [Rhodobacter aestuarii]SIS41201.1 cell division protein FtsZ [Rhodobacter aestuarii]